MFLREYGNSKGSSVFKSFSLLQVLLINPSILFALAKSQLTWEFDLLVMVINNNQIPEFVDILQLGIVQDES